jgi:hypothetical protein
MKIVKRKKEVYEEAILGLDLLGNIVVVMG